MPSLKLVWRSLMRRPLRSVLTIASLAVAVFLLCTLRSVITSMHATADAADPRRLDVLSASGLFVELPLSYQAKLDAIPGIEKSTKFQWFGGYYRSQANFFAQFAIDPDTMFDMYPECVVPRDQIEELRRVRTGCIIGRSLQHDYGWQIGDTIPLIGALHPHPDDKAWEFKVVGIYDSALPSFDTRTMFFRWDYLEETLKSGGVTPGVGVYALRVRPDANVPQVIAEVESQFANSDQRVQCATEAEFQRQFQTMFGNIPLFMSWIGGGVLIAILVACINTMLMAMREQTLDVGVLKALGFTDASVFALFMLQSLFLCAVGGGLGIFIAVATESGFAQGMEKMTPHYSIEAATLVLGAVVAVAVGLLAGFVPASHARTLRCVQALRGAD